MTKQTRKTMRAIKGRLYRLIEMHGRACGFQDEMDRVFLVEDRLLDFIARELDRRENKT